MSLDQQWPLVDDRLLGFRPFGPFAFVDACCRICILRIRISAFRDSPLGPPEINDRSAYPLTRHRHAYRPPIPSFSPADGGDLIASPRRPLPSPRSHPRSTFSIYAISLLQGPLTPLPMRHPQRGQSFDSLTIPCRKRRHDLSIDPREDEIPIKKRHRNTQILAEADVIATMRWCVRLIIHNGSVRLARLCKRDTLGTRNSYRDKAAFVACPAFTCCSARLSLSPLSHT